MENMKSCVSVSGVIVCVAIVLRIEPAVAFSWKNVSTNIIACEHANASLIWEYELQDGEHVQNKIWFTGVNESGRLIASLKDTGELRIEPEYRERITMIGNNSLLLKDVTINDEGLYTLIANFPLSSQPDPRLTLNLTVYIPPLKETGCCKPDINASNLELHAFLYSLQGCGKPSPTLTWTNARNKTVMNDKLILGIDDKGGTYKVCVRGPAVDRCFNGDRDALCRSYTVPIEIQKESEVPKTEEQYLTMIAVLTTLAALIVLTVIVFLVRNRRRIMKCRKRNTNGKFVRESSKFDDDDRMLQSPILTEEEKMDKATLEIAHIMYLEYNNSKELALQKINTARAVLENSEINYINNDSCDEEEVGILTANHQTNPSYAQCLYHNEKPLKLLIVQGDLGIGKTAWCRKFVKTWCEAHECQYHRIPIENKSEGVQTLNSFPLLFLVSLRNVVKDQSLKDIIKQQCMLGRDTKNGQFYGDLDLLMEKRPDKLIFIIHGVDEADADVSNLDTIVSETKDSLTILTCREWEPLRSKYGIREEDYQPMAYFTLKHIDTKNLKLYASSIFDDYGYPQDAVYEFMGLVRQNQLEQLMEEPFFVQPLIKIWNKCDTLPSDTAEVCLCFIEDNLKEKREQLREYTTLNLKLDVPSFIPKARGKIFVIRYGQVLSSLGKVAQVCLLNKGSKNIFLEDSLMEYTNIHDKRLTEICIAAKLVSTAPVSDSGIEKKRLCFRHRMIQRFLVAFHLACEKKSQIEDLQSEESKIIHNLLISLTSTRETDPYTT